ncbi:MAG: flagellar hook-length control protein FliK [Chlamydiales bacterium]|jgi:flagellar hook-length control protein FliK
METLNFPVSLRSLDVSGRSLGTERLSSAPSGVGPDPVGFAETLDAELAPEAAAPTMDSPDGARTVGATSLSKEGPRPDAPAPMQPEQTEMLTSLEDLGHEMVNTEMTTLQEASADKAPEDMSMSEGQLAPTLEQLTSIVDVNAPQPHGEADPDAVPMDAGRNAEPLALSAFQTAHPARPMGVGGSSDHLPMDPQVGVEVVVDSPQMDIATDAKPMQASEGTVLGEPHTEPLGDGKYPMTSDGMGSDAGHGAQGSTSTGMDGLGIEQQVGSEEVSNIPDVASSPDSVTRASNYLLNDSEGPIIPTHEPMTDSGLVEGKPGGPEQVVAAAAAPVPNPAPATKPVSQSEPVDPAQPLSQTTDTGGLSEPGSEAANNASVSADEQAPTAPIAREGSAPEIRAEHSLNTSTSAERAAEPNRADGPTGPALTEGRPSPEAIERAERVLSQVRLQLRPDMRQATLELRPASLGHIRIQLEVKEGEVTAIIRADRPETLSILERHLPELRSMFQQSGVDVADLDLGLGTEADAEAEPGDTQNGQRGSSNDAAPAMEIDQPLESALATRIGELGVDTYA